MVNKIQVIRLDSSSVKMCFLLKLVVNTYHVWPGSLIFSASLCMPIWYAGTRHHSWKFSPFMIQYSEGEIVLKSSLELLLHHASGWYTRGCQQIHLVFFCFPPLQETQYLSISFVFLFCAIRLLQTSKTGQRDFPF